MGCRPDRTGESPLTGRAGAGTRRVTPPEPDKHQSLQSVLWKVEPDSGEITGSFGNLKLSGDG